MSPWAILAIVVAFGGCLAGAEHFGDVRGTNQQKVADQTQFDKVNADLAKNKADAAQIYETEQAKIIALQGERDAAKTQLENEHADNEKATNALRSQLAGERLRFAAAQDTGSRAGGAGAMPANANPASDSTAAVCVVSDAVDADLKSIAYDADSLRDDYKLLYEWAHSLK